MKVHTSAGNRDKATGDPNMVPNHILLISTAHGGVCWEDLPAEVPFSPEYSQLQ